MKIERAQIHNEKAMVLRGCLLIADLHIGIEHEMLNKGVVVPSQIGRIEKKILRLIDLTNPRKLIILGDLKHNIPGISLQEYGEIPRLIERLSERTEVIIIKGNHDGNIERLLPDTRVLMSLVLNDTFLLHGHAWAGMKDSGAKFAVMGHIHPSIQFTDDLGYTTKESAWIKTFFRRDGEDLEVIIMPAFNDLITGTPFNRAKKEELLGPILKSSAIDVQNGHVYLIDGTYLGRVMDL